jgi:SSS family solute:Na+ symporter
VVERLTGLSMAGAVVAITGVTLVYTFFGGMRAVVWTDVAQFVIYLTGAIVAFAIMVGRLPAGLDTIWAEAGSDKLRVFDPVLDLTKPYTLWAGLIGGAFLSLGSHGVDQLIVQRLLSARNQREAGWALGLSGVVVLVQFAFFLLVGLALFAYYRTFPPEVPFQRGDTVFRDFLLTQLPTGVLGLVLGAVFSAAMSSFSSSLNSSSAAFVGDFLLPITGRDPSSRFVLSSAKAATVVFAAFEAVVALTFVDDRTIIDQVLDVAALTTGVLLGVFFLGTLTRRVDQSAALVGFVAGVTVDLLCKFALPALVARQWPEHAGWKIAWPWFGLIGSATTFGTGVLVSWLRRRSAPVP